MPAILNVVHDVQEILVKLHAYHQKPTKVFNPKLICLYR